MKVLFVSDHYVTPLEPGVLRTWQLARYLGHQGDRVHVVAPRAYFPFASATSERADDEAEPDPDGVRISWMRTGPPRAGLAGRVAAYSRQLVEATRAVMS